MSSEIYRNLKSELEQGKKAVVITFIDTAVGFGEFSHYKIMFSEEQLCSSNTIPCLDETACNMAKCALKTGNTQYFLDSNGTNILIEPYFPKPHLIVLGGGYMAQTLSEFGAKVGFSVTVVDDRPTYANKDRFPEADEVICENFNNCFDQMNLNEYSYVVIFTREHRHDLECLEQVLNHKIAYVGMIGSKISVSRVKKELLKEGFNEEQIDKVNAPIGLEIGAITPEEIAISIMAQIIRCRRLLGTLKGDLTSDPGNWPELDQRVLEALCEETGDPKAVVTIVATKGSVPRRAGAKMLVWPYGMTIGSIGGGYAEGEIINSAWQIIGSGGLKIHDIDMTGQIAEEEGMICGGVMSILIEDEDF